MISNPAEVEAEIMRFVGLLEKATQMTAQRARKAAEADTAYDLTYYRALLEAEGTVDERRATAKLAAADELAIRNYTAAELESSKEAARNLRCQLDSLRSINANVRFLLEKG